ncbi:hypothetical protein IFM89_021366 [Coptis chinensis]|uniref:Replication protein A OB domain-containing protein n=1 Tax=Coptis chinensis TaxID=261450 RepID=A0A835M8U7_9MAGN|nr:hypothetical protein IFM89_021366 [Coptis chinensis]
MHRTARCKADIDFLEEEYPAYPTTINDEILHEHVERVGKLLLGPKNVTTANKVMAGEDFGFYQGVIPGVMFGIGIRNEDLGSVHSPHSPHFFLDEDVLPLGVALHTALAEIYLNNQWESVDKKDLRIESQDLNMAEKEYTRIKEIKESNGNYKIKVRVSRIWEAIDYTTNTVKSLDTLLLDEHGDQIHAKIPSFIIGKYKPQLKEMQIYHIEDFSTLKIFDNVTYRPVNHPYIIKFKWNTIVKPNREFDTQFPKQQFDFVDFTKVSSRKDNKHLTDIIGIVSTWSQPVEQKKKNNTVSTMMELYLKDERNNSIQVTIWGENAKIIKDWILKNSSGKTVLIITSASISEFYGSYSLSTTSATKVYQNSDIQEIANLKNRYILKMEIEDNTATAMATLFEQEASSLLQKSAKELLTMEENGTEIAEKEFGRLIGHTTIFQIRVTRFNKEQNNNSLTISKIFPVNKIDNTEQNQKDNYDATPSDNASRNTKITHQITHHSKAHLDGTVATIIEDSNNTNDGEDEQPPTKRICRTNEDNQE